MVDHLFLSKLLEDATKYKVQTIVETIQGVRGDVRSWIIQI